MEMDDCDKKNLYEVTKHEGQEMEFEDKGVVKTNHQVISKMRIGVAILIALPLLIWTMIVILQVVTLVHLNLVPMECLNAVQQLQLQIVQAILIHSQVTGTPVIIQI